MGGVVCGRRGQSARFFPSRPGFKKVAPWRERGRARRFVRDGERAAELEIFAVCIAWRRGYGCRNGWADSERRCWSRFGSRMGQRRRTETEGAVGGIRTETQRSVFTVDPREVFAKKSAPPAPLCPQPDLCVPLCPHMAGAAPHLCTAMGGRERLSASPQREQFMLRYRGPANCWLGLHRAEGDEHWTWADGSAFTNWFEVRGGGRCAYLNGDRISSALCHTEKLWVCSRADSFILWRNGTNPQ
uniref:C-type lectin domain-containing protein n=1 Tax=Phasianus colchicus TaxID=9054 RepID=A0A669PZU0_PHACC